MFNLFKSLTIVFYLTFSFSAFAQSGYKVTYFHPKTQLPASISFTDAGNIPSTEDPSIWFKNNLKANSDFDLQFQRSNTDAKGYTHLRYQQFYKGFPIEGAEIILHMIGQKIISLNGKFFPQFTLNLQQNLDKENAVQKALSIYGNAVFKWEVNSEEQQLKRIKNNPLATYRPIAIPVIINNNDSFKKEAFKLAYKIDVFVHLPMSHELVYIDAFSGEIVDRVEQICTIDKVGIAHTRYSGIKFIHCDSINADSFILYDSTRGKGIHTIDTRVISVTDSFRNFSDSDNVWNNVNFYQDEVATDVHWGTEMTFDYYKDTFERWSYSGDSAMILSRVHVGDKFNNAFWDGVAANYGDGDRVKMQPLTSLDIVAHELTHGITQYTAGLRYENESGALNESFSDIFGKTIQHIHDTNNFSWYIADQIVIGSKTPFRSMSNPVELDAPKYYYGIKYYTGQGDNGGVHINSGVQNHWFYLLVNGGIGKREDNKFYRVEALGFDKAARVAYSNLSSYLTSFSDYYDASYLSLDAAATLFGENSFEWKQVQSAWYAVGFFEELSVDQQSSYQSNWTVMPNPGNLQITLFNPDNDQINECKIVDITGKSVLMANVGPGEPIDVSALENGIYFIRIGNVVLKWVKA